MRGWFNMGTIGHVDHGKSTLAGCLLYNLDEFTDKDVRDTIDFAKARGEEDKIFAYLLDRRPDERERGLSIDIKHIGFEYKERRYMLVDNPGHENYVMNLITGACQVEIGILVIAANEYEKALEKTGSYSEKNGTVRVKGLARLHTSLAEFFGMEQIIIIISKMDLVEFSKDVYDSIVRRINTLSEEIGLDNIKRVAFIPTSIDARTLTSDNVTSVSSEMSWYRGDTLLKAITRLQLPIQDVQRPFRFRADCDPLWKIPGTQVVILGKVLTGKVSVGDEIIILPRKVRGRVASIKMRDEKKRLGRQSRWERISTSEAGDIVGLGIRTYKKIGKKDLCRGSLLSDPENAPSLTHDFIGEVVTTLQPSPRSRLSPGQDLKIRFGSFESSCIIRRIGIAIDFDTGEFIDPMNSLPLWQKAVVHFSLDRPVEIDESKDNPKCARFLFLNMKNFIAGGGRVVLIPKEAED